MMLPLPIIWLDDSLSYGAQLSATLVPVLIQGYVGNFLVRQPGALSETPVAAS